MTIQAHKDRSSLLASQRIKGHILLLKVSTAKTPKRRMRSLSTPSVDPFTASSHWDTHCSLGIPDFRLLLHQGLRQLEQAVPLVSDSRPDVRRSIMHAVLDLCLEHGLEALEALGRPRHGRAHLVQTVLAGLHHRRGRGGGGRSRGRPDDPRRGPAAWRGRHARRGSEAGVMRGGVGPVGGIGDGRWTRHAGHGRVGRDGAIQVECEGGLGAAAVQVGLAFGEVVLHALDVVGAGVLVAVEAEGPLLSVCLILKAALADHGHSPYGMLAAAIVGGCVRDGVG